MESALVDRNDSEIQMETRGDGKRHDQQGRKKQRKSRFVDLRFAGAEITLQPCKKVLKHHPHADRS